MKHLNTLASTFVIVFLAIHSFSQTKGDTPAIESNDLVIKNLQTGKADSSDAARKLVRQSIDAIGGVENLRAVKTVKLEGISYQNHLMDSEHPTGPFGPDFERFKEFHDLINKSSRHESTTDFAQGGNAASILVVSEGLAAASRQGSKGFQVTPAESEWYVRTPERAVLTALEAGDLHLEKDEITQSVPHYVVAFTWQKTPVRLFINKYNSLPTAVETIKSYPYDILKGMWGDFRTRVIFSQWNLEPGGVHYPRQWDVEWNGEHYAALTLTDVTLNPSLSSDLFFVPEQIKKAFAPRSMDDYQLGNPQKPAQEIMPDVIQIPGTWYTTIVRQTDGLVIIEAPFSNGYSAKVIAEAEKRFPKVPIKAVITCSSYWWHFAGLREYAARGIQIYALDLNKSLIEKFLAAQHTLNPDLLAKQPRNPKIKFVSGKTVIGDGDNRLEIYPIRAAAAQMMMVYFPHHQVLYTAEMAQPLGPGGSFIYPHDLSSLLQTIKDEKIPVKTVIGMHMSPTPLDKVADAVDKAIAPAASDKKN